MHTVSELTNRHPNSEIFIVGTGASMRVFPLEFLKDKITIGLNQAWKIAAVKYGITIRPELNIPEFMDHSGYDDIVWITKHEKFTNEEQRAYAARHPNRFFYYHTNGKKNEAPPGQPSDAGRVPALVEQPPGDFLYLWSSISQSAVHLAANMGARTIILIGCDNCALAENHHAHEQHTMWKGEDPDVRYRQYEIGLSEVRTALRRRGVQVLNLTPFVSLKRPDEDFVHLCGELQQPVLIENQDISKGDRTCQGPKSDLIVKKGPVRRFLGELGAKIRTLGRATEKIPASATVAPAAVSPTKHEQFAAAPAKELPVAGVLESGQFALKANLHWLADRSWLKPYERYLEPDRQEPLPPTRILDRRFTLVQFAQTVRALPGSTAECGVFRGVGSALICKTLEGTYQDGQRHYAFDSFEGLPPPTAADRIGLSKPAWKKGHLRCSRETVQNFLKEFPHCRLEQGWIPQTLATVQNESFRLVHVDVDLHDPTTACLDFFYPRMVPGGILLFDDYGSGFCPGARAAIDKFFQDQSEQVVELVTGQAFIIKQPAAKLSIPVAA